MKTVKDIILEALDEIVDSHGLLITEINVRHTPIISCEGKRSSIIDEVEIKAEVVL